MNGAISFNGLCRAAESSLLAVESLNFVAHVYDGEFNVSNVARERLFHGPVDGNDSREGIILCSLSAKKTEKNRNVFTFVSDLFALIQKNYVIHRICMKMIFNELGG